VAVVIITIMTARAMLIMTVMFMVHTCALQRWAHGASASLSLLSPPNSDGYGVRE
jgi:hypothetical protein